MGKAGEHVVAVTSPNNLLAFDRAIMFFKRHDIGHDLTRMRAIGQPVDDWHRCVFRHLQNRIFFKRAHHNQINITRQNPRRICDRLTMPKLHISAGQHQSFAAHLADTNVKANARTG